MSSALVPVAAAGVAERRVSDVVGTVRYEHGELVVRLAPARAPRDAVGRPVPSVHREVLVDEHGPRSSPFHPVNGYEGCLRWVPPPARDPVEVARRAADLDWARRRYAATPRWLRWCWRWLS